MGHFKNKMTIGAPALKTPCPQAPWCTHQWCSQDLLKGSFNSSIEFKKAESGGAAPSR